MDALTNTTNSWEFLPSEALTTIITFLTLNDRCSASSVCRKWRELFFLPIFWRHLSLLLSTRKDGVRSEFLSKVACYVKYLDITWPHPWILDKRNLKQIGNTRPVDKDIANNLIIFFQALSQSSCLKSLIIKFENAGSHDEQFCDVVNHSISRILTNCRGLEFLSTGYPPKLTWMKATSLAANDIKLSNIRDLHTSCSKPTDEPLDKQSCENEFCNFKCFNKLQTLSINWIDITSSLIDSLCTRGNNASKIQKLMIHLHTHNNCQENRHPSEEQWQKFTAMNPNLKITLIILKSLTDICSAVKNIVGNVHMVKFLECDEIQAAPFSNLMNWFQNTLECHVYVSTKKPIDLSNGETLYVHATVCQNLKYLSIHGYYIEDNDLLAVAQSFPKLEQLIVTKAHILTFALATMYMVPVSGAKYTHFQAQMSRHLKKPWRALASQPFDQLFFTEGKDDEFYITGKISCIVEEHCCHFLFQQRQF